MLKWKPYLLGKHFEVRSDQQSLCYLTQQREVNPEYQKWVTKLLGFDFKIQYKAGTTNRAADALSRKQVGEIILSSLLTVPTVSWTLLEEEINKDTTLQRLKQDLHTGDREYPGYTLVDDKLLYKARHVIPRGSRFCASLLHEYHYSVTGGHSGELKTYLRLANDWFWAGIRNDMIAYVQQCHICQQQKTSQRSPAGLLQPVPVPTQV